MRYNDLDDTSFIKRGYPHSYIYKPIDEYLTPEFDTKKEINTINIIWNFCFDAGLILCCSSFI